METLQEQATRTAVPGMNSQALVHEMLVLDAFLEAPLLQSRHQSITRKFVAELLDVLGMEALGELGIWPAVDEREPGWSFIQPITTSHVSAHYFRNPGGRPHLRLDAYSCASIDFRKLVRLSHRHFRLTDWCASFIKRELELPGQRRIVDIAGFGDIVRSQFSLQGSPAFQKEI